MGAPLGSARALVCGSARPGTPLGLFLGLGLPWPCGLAGWRTSRGRRSGVSSSLCRGVPPPCGQLAAFAGLLLPRRPRGPSRGPSYRQGQGQGPEAGSPCASNAAALVTPSLSLLGGVSSGSWPPVSRAGEATPSPTGARGPSSSRVPGSCHRIAPFNLPGDGARQDSFHSHCAEG